MYHNKETLDLSGQTFLIYSEGFAHSGVKYHDPYNVMNFKMKKCGKVSHIISERVSVLPHFSLRLFFRDAKNSECSSFPPSVKGNNAVCHSK